MKAPRFPLASARAGLALLAVLGLAGPARPDVFLHGEYNSQLDLRKQDRNFQWDFDSNNNDTYTNAQFQLLAQPRKGVEGFLKYEAEWQADNNNTPRPLFQYRESDLKYRWENGTRGAETVLFSRQGGRFWVDNHLIKVVDNGPPSNDGNAQGVRLDTWGFLGGATATFIASDFSGQFDPSGTRKDPSKTDDAYIARIRREFLHRDLRIGMTFNQKVENEPNEGHRAQASVVAGDARYTWHGMDFSLEYAQSFTDSSKEVPSPTVTYPDGLGQHFLGIPLNDRGVWVGEIRSIKLGNTATGYLNLAPVAWLRGPEFDNRLGESNRDERGYLINTWYLVPQRAITLTNNYLSYTKRATLREHVREIYSEAYVEFVNGFTGKFYYKSRRTTDNGGTATERTDKNDDVFGEVTVESKLAWFRLEGKLKNLNTVFEKQLASIEARVNLGTSTALYNRLMFGNDPAGLRRIYFTQLQYRPASNMEVFLEYGPSWIGSSPQPVDDGNLEGDGRQKDLIKLWLKGWF